ncbi:MAG: GNAT family N-acetyltransferase, partial [Phycisphaerae bacterium]
RSERARCEQVARWESLEYGVAHWSPAFPDLPAANQLQDVWLADLDPEAVYERAECFYRDRNACCHTWMIAATQDIAPIEELLDGKGWIRRDLLAMGLSHWDSLREAVDESIRILPARAMPKAYRAALADDGKRDASFVKAGIERLNDAQVDAFVAMVDGKPAGRIGYLEVGDIARLAEYHVPPHERRRDISNALLRHFLEMARRLMPRIIVAGISADDNPHQSSLEHVGFSVAGGLAQFHRPPR